MIDVKKSADLARIQLSDSELTKFGKQLAEVISHFHALEAVNTDGVEPLITPTQIDERWRDDIRQEGLATELALSQAPERQGQLFKVPPVIG